VRHYGEHSAHRPGESKTAGQSRRHCCDQPRRGLGEQVKKEAPAVRSLWRV
jgi:hypothetical protein